VDARAVADLAEVEQLFDGRVRVGEVEGRQFVVVGLLVAVEGDQLVHEVLFLVRPCKTEHTGRLTHICSKKTRTLPHR
jgi:hypothetical protein